MSVTNPISTRSHPDAIRRGEPKTLFVLGRRAVLRPRSAIRSFERWLVRSCGRSRRKNHPTRIDQKIRGRRYPGRWALVPVEGVDCSSHASHASHASHDRRCESVMRCDGVLSWRFESGESLVRLGSVFDSCSAGSSASSDCVVFGPPFGAGELKITSEHGLHGCK